MLQRLNEAARGRHGGVEALALKVRSLAFGDGVAGLAAGQGLTLRFCPPGVDGFVSDGFVVVSATGNAAADDRAALLGIAEAVLRNEGLDAGLAACARLAEALRPRARPGPQRSITNRMNSVDGRYQKL
jgi:hypothetical protein